MIRDRTGVVLFIGLQPCQPGEAVEDKKLVIEIPKYTINQVKEGK